MSSIWVAMLYFLASFFSTSADAAWFLALFSTLWRWMSWGSEGMRGVEVRGLRAALSTFTMAIVGPQGRNHVQCRHKHPRIWVAMSRDIDLVVEDIPGYPRDQKVQTSKRVPRHGGAGRKKSRQDGLNLAHDMRVLAQEERSRCLLCAGCVILGLGRSTPTWMVFLNFSSISRYCAAPFLTMFFFFSLLASSLCRATRVKIQPYDLVGHTTLDGRHRKLCCWGVADGGGREQKGTSTVFFSTASISWATFLACSLILKSSERMLLSSSTWQPDATMLASHSCSFAMIFSMFFLHSLTLAFF